MSGIIGWRQNCEQFCYIFLISLKYNNVENVCFLQIAITLMLRFPPNGSLNVNMLHPPLCTYL